MQDRLIGTKIAIGVLMLFTAIAAIAGSPPLPGQSSQPLPNALTGVSYNYSICQPVNTGASLDVDAALAGILTTAQQSAVRSLVVTYADPSVPGPVCVGIGQSSITCTPSAAGSAPGFINGYGSQITYLLRERASPGLPDIAARAASATAVVCFEVQI